MTDPLGPLEPADLAGIRALLEAHHVLHLATTGPEGPHSTPLFFALAGDGLELVWISDPATLHSRQLAADPRVAASVSASAPSPLSIEGLQLHGAAERPEADQAALRETYLARFPATRALLAVSSVHRFYRLRPAWVRWIRWAAGIKRNREGTLPAPPDRGR